MDFVIQWLWYLLAFVAGSAIARVVTNVVNRHTSNGKAPADVTESGTGTER